MYHSILRVRYELLGVAYGLDGLDILSKKFNPELVFECHRDFYDIQAVSVQIGGEAHVRQEMRFVDAKFCGKDFSDAFGSVAHGSIPFSGSRRFAAMPAVQKPPANSAQGKPAARLFVPYC